MVIAAATGMPKSSVYVLFGSKEELQLATVDEAARIFQAEVVDPAVTAPPGIDQLLATCEAFFDHLLRRTFPGGCFFASAALEMGTRPGPVKQRIAVFQTGFAALLRQFATTAIQRHQLSADEDPAQLAFELNGIILATDVSFVFNNDPQALDVARHVVRRRLGVRDRQPATLAATSSADKNG